MWVETDGFDFCSFRPPGIIVLLRRMGVRLWVILGTFDP